MANSSYFINLSVRIYQTLMYFYPSAFRKKFGSEMIYVFQKLATHSLQRYGHAGLVMIWFRVLGDLVRSAFHQHFIELQRRLEMKPAPDWFAKSLAILSVTFFWLLPLSPILSIAAVSTTDQSTGWSRKFAVGGAILCTSWTLVCAAGLCWIVYILHVNP